MITYVVCDLFLSPARVLVNTVNTVGVMGKGIAKEFKQIYPEMFKEYQGLCERDLFDIGDLWLYKTNNKWVLNFPTKRHWRQPSKPEYIEAGLRKFADTYHMHGITSISFPLLGCGNGELDWESQVRPLMEQYLQDLPITVFIHLQHRQDPFMPEHRDIKQTKTWLRSEPESLAFAEVWEDLQGLLSAPTELFCFNSESGFIAQLDRKSEAVILSFDDEEVRLPSDALVDLWQQVRQSGFVAAESMPCGLDQYGDYLVRIMSMLPYIKPVAMAHTYAGVAKEPVGLRLVSRPKATQLPLLASVGVLEPE